MVILKLKNGKIKEYNLPSEEKEASLYGLWKEINEKKIVITDKNGNKENIRLVDIDDCMVGKEAEIFKRGNPFEILENYLERLKLNVRNIFK
jgi:hypothetical protein